MSKNNKLKKFYNNKKILITGHTGFVGSWLTFMMIKLGAKVYGISKNTIDNSVNYKVLRLKDYLKGEYFFDIVDFKILNSKIKQIKPNIIFHLAAQPYVMEGYKNPLETISTNIIGTANLVKSAITNKIKHNVIITSDKVYKNSNKKTFFNENSEMGGSDPYSMSKSCAELVTRSFSESYNTKLFIDTVRAGNIIGGGDFGKNRLITDIYFAKFKKRKLILRYPNAIRPWQNVLDAIHAYSLIPLNQDKRKKSYDSWNIGPRRYEGKISVKKLVEKFLLSFDVTDKTRTKFKISKHKESKILMLNSYKIRKKLNWENIFNINTTIKQTGKWYKIFQNKDMINLRKHSESILNQLLDKV